MHPIANSQYRGQFSVTEELKNRTDGKGEEKNGKRSLHY